MAKKLGELLVGAGLISPDQLEQGLSLQQRRSGRLGLHLIERGFVGEEEVTQALSRQISVPAVFLNQLEIDRDTLDMIPAEMVRKHGVLPVARRGATLTLAMVDPRDDFARDAVKFKTGYQVEPVVSCQHTLLKALAKYYGQNAKPTRRISHGLAKVSKKGAKSLKSHTPGEHKNGASRNSNEFVDAMLAQALAWEASAVHVEITATPRVRMRVGGSLRDYAVDATAQNGLAARIRELVGQKNDHDGQGGLFQAQIEAGGKTRTTVFEVVGSRGPFGVKWVFRPKPADTLKRDLTQLGLEPPIMAGYLRACQRGGGVILVCGPRGCGKTQTLYATLRQLDQTELSLAAVEEAAANLEGVHQIQPGRAGGQDRAQGLRNLLDLDPDVILVGELADAETGKVAMRAGLAGHLVLAGMVAGNSGDALERLQHMEIEPFAMAHGLRGILAQRLVRRICTDCRQEIEVPRPTLIDLGLTPQEAGNVVIRAGTGCGRCGYSGTHGHTGLFEWLEISADVRRNILLKTPGHTIRKSEVKNGMINLRRSGLHKLRKGIIPIEAVVETSPP